MAKRVWGAEVQKPCPSQYLGRLGGPTGRIGLYIGGVERPVKECARSLVQASYYDICLS